MLKLSILISLAGMGMGIVVLILLVRSVWHLARAESEKVYQQKKNQFTGELILAILALLFLCSSWTLRYWSVVQVLEPMPTLMTLGEEILTPQP